MIQTNKLTKYYGKSIGIEKVDLKLKKGKLYGFVGPNGAGKSTTIKTLLGFLFKTSGGLNSVWERFKFGGSPGKDTRVYYFQLTLWY